MEEKITLEGLFEEVVRGFRAEIEELRAEIAELRAGQNEVSAKVAAKTAAKSHGGAGLRKMERLDAWRVVFGDLNPKAKTNSEAAELLSLSYSQVFNCRARKFTFLDLRADEFSLADIPKKDEAA